MRLSVSPGANAACSSLLRGEVGMCEARRLALRASRDSDCLKHPPLNRHPRAVALLGSLLCFPQRTTVFSSVALNHCK